MGQLNYDIQIGLWQLPHGAEIHGHPFAFIFWNRLVEPVIFIVRVIGCEFAGVTTWRATGHKIIRIEANRYPSNVPSRCTETMPTR